MTDTLTLEGEAAAGLREAARRAGFDDVSRFVADKFPLMPSEPDHADEPERSPDGLTRGERVIQRLRAVKPKLLMTSDEVMEMTRGKDWRSAVPFDDDEEQP
jgi:hypothetical protein